MATVSRGTDSSGGFADVGRRQYTVRFVGQFQPGQLNQLIVGWSNDRPIYLSEIAEVEIVPRKQDGFTLRNGFPSYYITVQSEFGANTVSILDEVNKVIVELNEGPLAGAGLAIDLSFDASVHIRRAIALVKGNLGIGLLLAVAVLYFLMRSRRATFLVTATVPLSVLVAFLALRLFDKSLNVISLAGLAFSVGLVMDAAIITLENIVRCHQNGDSLEESVTKGTRQITGELFASTLTSVAIFVPVLFMEGMEGQLFQDRALRRLDRRHTRRLDTRCHIAGPAGAIRLPAGLLQHATGRYRRDDGDRDCRHHRRTPEALHGPREGTLHPRL